MIGRECRGGTDPTRLSLSKLRCGEQAAELGLRLVDSGHQVGSRHDWGRDTRRQAMIRKGFLTLSLMGFVPLCLSAQTADRRPPVIDLHLHAPMRAGPVEDFSEVLRSDLEELERRNVRYVMLTGVPDVLFAWREELEDRVGVLPGLLFPCVNGQTVMFGRPCFENGADWPDLQRLRDDIEAGRVGALGEITTQFLGLGPSDPALEPYFALAEEYDLPVFIHMGPGTPGMAYAERVPGVGVPNYRATAGNPLLLEEALLKHPGVRVAAVHAGWPLADEMVFMLYQHPQVYAEVGLLQVSEWFPRREYHSFLRRLVDAGFADRILFGSDASLSDGIDAILEADFLTGQQKRDILCGNAARFLRLDEEICR